MSTGKDKKALDRYLETKKHIRKKTENTVPIHETIAKQRGRIETLINNPEKFCHYYFPHYTCDKEGNSIGFGWFHKKAFKEIQPDTLTVLEWSREHAKSVLADIFMPMLMYARGELDGMVLVSANQDKASNLLSDLQAEFESNELWKHDFGNLVSVGSWESSYFATTDGIGFWAFGLGQSPRGIREREKRPNYCCIDDADTKERCKNESRVDEAVSWIREDLFGAMGLVSGARFVAAGNRIHKKSIIAKMVGDIEPSDPKNDGVIHIKVYAIENPKNHLKADIDDPNSVPAWKERYTKETFRKRFEKIGYIAAQREYFHEHIEKGKVFKNEWIKWAKTPKEDNIIASIVYTDPSFTNSKDSDYKATVCVSLHMYLGKLRYHIRRAWVKQATIKNMVEIGYDWYDWLGDKASYYIESNMLQRMLLDEFDTEGSNRGYILPIRGDSRRKGDKFTRIENLTPLFEREFIDFNEAERKDPNMQTGIEQFLAFPTGHDDFPDAVEGAIYLLNQMNRVQSTPIKVGKYNKTSSRR